MSSLFLYHEVYIDQFEKNHHIKITNEFLKCADIKLTNDFEIKTGLKVNKLISIGWANDGDFIYQSALVSKFTSKLWIGNNNTHIVYVVWKSYSGRIYRLNDTGIDCADIHFWLEGLDPLLYQKQLFPKMELPFKLKNLSYQLTIHRLNMDCCIEIFLKKEYLIGIEIFISNTNKFIDNFNRASEKKDRKYGVVHNWSHVVEHTKLVYMVDMGFSGPYFLQQFLEFLSKLNMFEKVEVR